MSGTINLALTQQFDTQGDPLSGGLLYFFTAGTTTPQTAFQDTPLTIAHPNPIILDASGRVPMFYLADGFIKIRLTDKNGLVIIAADQLLVIGPSSGGGGGGGSFDPNTVLQTGDIKCRYGTGTLTGFARCNGNTIGSTGSSATELAGPTAQALYEYLWPFTNILLDSATKGASAVADFGALKRLILPDIRGRVIAGMDDMGALAGAASRLTPAYFGTSAIALGAVGGDEKSTLAEVNLPKILPAGTVTAVSGSGSSAGTGSSSGSFSGSISGTASGMTVPGNTGNTPGGAAGAMANSTGGSGVNIAVGDGSVSGTCGGSYSGSASVSGSASISGGSGTFTGTPFGNGVGNPGVPVGTAGAAHRTISPAMVMTIYIKL